MGIRVKEGESITLDVAGAEVSLDAMSVAKLWIDKVRQEHAAVVSARPGGLTINPPRIGEYWEGQGGLYAGDILGKRGGPQWSLVVPTDPSGQVEDMQYGGRGIDDGATDDYDGMVNTAKLFDSAAEHPIAKWARSLMIDGRSDFYAPARCEARLCSINVPWLFNKDVWYWTSTQHRAGPDWAWLQDFDDGDQDHDS